MNKRIIKKHNKQFIGLKSAGKMYNRCEIGNHICRKCREAGVEPNKRAVWSITHDIMVHYSYSKLVRRLSDAYMPEQTLLSSKHLLIPSADCINMTKTMLNALDIPFITARQASNACEAMCMDD